MAQPRRTRHAPSPSSATPCCPSSCRDVRVTHAEDRRAGALVSPTFYRIRRRGRRPRLARGLGYAVRARPRRSRRASQRPNAATRTTAMWSWRGRLRQALVRLNPDLPPEALDDAYPQADARGRAIARRAQPRAAPHARRRRDGRVPPAGRLDRRGAGTRPRLRRRPRTTTGSPSTSSPSPRASTTAGRTSCCSSTACRWR